MSDSFNDDPESRLTNGNESSISNATDSLDSFFESYVDATDSNVWLKLLKENIFEKFDTELDELIVKYGNSIDREKIALKVAVGLVASKVIFEVVLNINNINYTPDVMGNILMIMVAGMVVTGLGVHFRGKRTEIKNIIDESLGVEEWLNEKFKNQEKKLEDGVSNTEYSDFGEDENQAEQEG
jgi:hypothetical protein